jgi:aminoglycoside 2''-phosphotransferase
MALYLNLELRLGPNASNCPTMDLQSAHLEKILAALPDLPIRLVQTGLRGEFNTIMLVNDELIFRFPRSSHVAAALPGALVFLRAIRQWVTLPIPDPTHQSQDFQAVGDAFISYRKIPGAPLWRETLQAVDDETLDTVIIQLASFLRALHGVPPSVVANELANLDSRDRWADFYANVRDKLFPHMRPDGRSAVARHFETFLENPKNFDYAPSIRHGDPGPGNILFDQAARRLTGVIDFDFAGLGDPAVDWSIVLAPCLYGERFVQRFQSLYPAPEPVLIRAQFYRGTWPFQVALRAIETRDEQAFRRELASFC